MRKSSQRTRRRTATRGKQRARSSKMTWSQRFRQLAWRLFFGATAIGIITFGVLFFAFDHQVKERFEGRKWALPARVYARPLDLYPGKHFSKAALVTELEGLGYHKKATVTQAGDFWVSHDRVRLFARSFRQGDLTIERQRLEVTFDERLAGKATIASLWQLDAHQRRSQPLDMMLLEPQEIGVIYPKSGEDRLLVKLSDIPPLLGESLIAVEDQNFAHHWGISPKSIARAAVANVKAGSVVQGGSTLSQQVVKNLFLTNEQHLWRKVREALMTLSLEWRYSKADILETYLNEVFLGQSGARAIHGFALASRFYFGRPLNDLDTGQIALLVGLVKGASYYNPWRHPERAQQRRNLVLKIMAQQGLISATEKHQLQQRPLGILKKPGSQHSFPAFIDLVKQQLKQEYREDDLRTQGLQIYTTLAPSVQMLTERQINTGIRALGKQHNTQSLQGAAVITEVGSGEIQAMVGDKNPKYQGFNRALHSQRSIGSLIKPAVYLTALRQDYTLASLIDDSPFSWQQENGDVWQPRNFSRTSHGQVPLYQGMTHSYNQATARLGMTLGLSQVQATLERLGARSDLPQVPAMLLGAVALSPLEVSELYHTLANDGVYTPLRSIRSVFTPRGAPLQRFPLTAEIRFDANTIQLLQFALQTVMHEGTGRKAYRYLSDAVAVAGKTGTTNDQRDSWFAGFHDAHLGVVWVGKDNHSPTPLTGSSGALPIWAKIFAQLPAEGLPVGGSNPLAADIRYHWVDAHSGEKSAEFCHNAVLLPFRSGSEPSLQAPCRRLSQQPAKRSSDAASSRRSRWSSLLKDILKPYIR